ncbi:UNVERIFIED_CONTAM: Retrovirus-related Pol polyprotein from transposon TNT 1-94 [Sesamum calycinum]|uniref:Retrovirus-related Pol polyprotein from transposon TNT 1-94 n=1 Tax=Sesamum calycinum TaxID=2727403 RepID=A0AAW2L8Y1_9LAMI
MINSLLLTSGLSKYLWGEALNTACHILNRVPLKHNTLLWKCRKPSLKYFRVWGCLAKVLVLEHKRKKLGPKTVDAVFLGYVETSYALRFLVIKSEILGIEVNTIFEFRDVVFLEVVFPMKTGIPSSVSLDDSLTSTSIPEHVEKMRRSGNFQRCYGFSEAKQWKEAVKSEMDSIVSNGTWVLVDLPPRCTTIGCKWIFKKKLKPDGSIDKFKAREVAKGFKQKEGIDYFDTYSPVARLTTIRVLIALASMYNLSIHQMNVKTTFLYGELEEEIYMDQPEGFVAYGYLRYLKGTVSLAIHYGRFLIVLEGYSDASWIAKNSGSNGCSGYVFTLGGGAVSWKSAKQTLITRSTFEAELCALDTTGTEVEWLFGLLSQLPIDRDTWPKVSTLKINTKLVAYCY